MLTRESHTLEIKLNTRFEIKDKTAQIHKHYLVYYAKCPDQSCHQDYLGETGGRNIKRTADCNGKGKHSHLFKQPCKENILTWTIKR